MEILFDANTMNQSKCISKDGYIMQNLYIDTYFPPCLFCSLYFEIKNDNENQCGRVIAVFTFFVSSVVIYINEKILVLYYNCLFLIHILNRAFPVEF